MEVLGLFLAALAIAFALYQTFRQTGPRLRFQYVGQRLIEGGKGLLPKEIVVQFEGTRVPRVSLSRINIWNAGRTAVRRDDIASGDPIRFSFGTDATILKVEIIRCSRAANNSEVSVENEDRGVFRYSFLFLDHFDGASIRVLHTGKAMQPEASGTIIGAPKGIECVSRIEDRQKFRDFYRFWDMSRRRSNVFGTSIGVTIGMVITLIAILLPQELLIRYVLSNISKFGVNTSITWVRIIIAAFGISYMAVFLYIDWAFRRKFAWLDQE